MKAKSYTAKDMKAALEAVRAELGEDALILSSRRDDFGNVVLAAMVDDSPQLIAGEVEEPSAVLETFDARHRRSVLARVRTPQKEQTSEFAFPFDRDTLFDILCAERTPDILAAELTDAAEESGYADLTKALAHALDQRIKSQPIDLSRPSSILLAGPMGSGKTNVAAKLAAEARLAGGEVRLIGTDAVGAGAVTRLKALAEPIEVEVSVITDGDALADTFEAAMVEGVSMIADTTGFDPRPKSAWREFLFLTRGNGEIVGVLSALSDAQEAVEMAHAFKDFGASRLIVTGLDLTRRRGTVIALAVSGLAIAQVSHSPFVAEGLSPLSPLSLARDIVARAAPHLSMPSRSAA
jgi:flagellar biosynthesis protein FlhF